MADGQPTNVDTGSGLSGASSSVDDAASISTDDSTSIGKQLVDLLDKNTNSVSEAQDIAVNDHDELISYLDFSVSLSIVLLVVMSLQFGASVIQVFLDRVRP